MSYLVFARKFRPHSFDTVVGQAHITRALQNAISKDRIGHSYLFTGPRGVGKTSSARVFARALNCLKTEVGAGDLAKVEPCGECSNCEQISSSKSLGVWEIDGASHNSVENVRVLIDSLNTVPPKDYRFKVYIIDEVHMLSTAAFNALLKSLEEPPPKTVFIFATTEPQKIPATVISRCQRFDFRQVVSGDIAKQLTTIASSEGFVLEPGAALFIARKAAGGMRDAQSMLERLVSVSDGKVTVEQAVEVFSSVDPQFYFRLSEAILEHRVKDALMLISDVFSLSLDVRSFCTDFLTHFRNLLLTKVSKEESSDDLARATDWSEEELCIAKEQLDETSIFDLERLYRIADEVCSNAAKSLSPKYLLEACVVRMTSQKNCRDISKLVSSLEVALQTSSISRLTPAATSLSEKVEQKKKPITSPEQKGHTSRAKTSVIENVKNSEGESPYVQESPQAEESPAESQANKKELNWKEFVSFVSGKRQVILSTYLKRAQPASFCSGLLSLKTPRYDAEHLLGADKQSLLKELLKEYSGVSSWKIKVEPLDNISGVGNKTAADGSIVMAREEKKQNLLKKIEKEAREDSSVKTTLKVFSGSSIKRVVPLQ